MQHSLCFYSVANNTDPAIFLLFHLILVLTSTYLVLPEVCNVSMNVTTPIRFDYFHQSKRLNFNYYRTYHLPYLERT